MKSLFRSQYLLEMSLKESVLVCTAVLVIEQDEGDEECI